MSSLPITIIKLSKLSLTALLLFAHVALSFGSLREAKEKLNVTSKERSKYFFDTIL